MKSCDYHQIYSHIAGLVYFSFNAHSKVTATIHSNDLFGHRTVVYWFGGYYQWSSLNQIQFQTVMPSVVWQVSTTINCLVSTNKNKMYRGWEIHWATACSSSVGRWAAPHWTEWRWGEGAQHTLRQTGWTCTTTAWEMEKDRLSVKSHVFVCLRQTAQPRWKARVVRDKVIRCQRVGTKGRVMLTCPHPNQQLHNHTGTHKTGQ